MRITTLLVLLLLLRQSYGQNAVAVQYAETITETDLKDYLKVLASDALEGRETGESGQKMAAAYIEHFFWVNNLSPAILAEEDTSYLQSFELSHRKTGECWIKLGEHRYQNLKDFVYTGRNHMDAPYSSKPVFVGFGREEDIKSMNVNGKDVLVYCDEGANSRKEKAQLALKHGANQVFIIQEESEDGFERLLAMYAQYYAAGKLTLPKKQNIGQAGYFMISKAMGLQFFKTNGKVFEKALVQSREGNYDRLRKLQPDEINYYATQVQKTVRTENVLAVVEGTDKKQECLVITAHYDHLGKAGDKVYNGADDDGSGTVAVMEIAQAFAEAKKAGHDPRRSIIFMAFTGEEKGLLGSSYYVNNPAVPLEQTITNLNIDMIGRVDDAHLSDPQYLYLIGSDRLSSELHQVSEDVNADYTHLALDYKYNDANDPNRYYYRSDHYNFAKMGVPVIFYFNGIHQDYHKTSDTLDKIDFGLLELRTRLIFYTAWEIANREKTIAVDVVKDAGK
jgi:hypothetical protein